MGLRRSQRKREQKKLAHGGHNEEILSKENGIGKSKKVAEWGQGRRRDQLINLHLRAREPATTPFVMLRKTFKGMTGLKYLVFRSINLSRSVAMISSCAV